MSLAQQGRHFVLVGAIQWALDCGVMVLLSHLGMSVEGSNVCGRCSGAILGFWLNGRITFPRQGTTMGRRQLPRFVPMWVCNTMVSTWMLDRVDALFGLHWAWLAKLGIELCLGLLTFTLSRHWIYRA